MSSGGGTPDEASPDEASGLPPKEPAPTSRDEALAGENRLAYETSPYLRQHRHNPVDWYPWGEEARRRARELDRPILLSIGYSACHWCHVMERESFDDPETARLMNQGFVSIKVDREERPDVDGIYMRAVQALTGRGGWPLTVFLTPDGEPFYGGTYFPPEPRQGMPSFPQILEATRSAWEDRRDDILGAASEIRSILERSTASSAEVEPDGAGLEPELTTRAVETLLRHLDRTHGGFGQPPKFPQPVVLGFLLEQSVFRQDRSILDAVLLTLRKMARGGIRDHLGGAFHRYSVDARWLVPHFEKMLYDNALLSRVYLRAFQLTADHEMERTCREVLEDLLDDFHAPEGGFYTARDADSDGEEGLYYLWTPEQVHALLPEEDARVFCLCYDVTKEGNFEGRSILHLPRELDDIARAQDLARDELDASLSRSRERLAAARSEREPPLRDEKILAAWNGLTFRTFAEAGAALDEPRYVAVAEQGMGWLLDALRPRSGPLCHQITRGEARISAFLEDVAGLGNAALSLYEATLAPRWLETAVELDREVSARFRDPDTGLLFDAPSDGEVLVVRPREVTDSPVPSGTSLAAELRLRLGRLMGDSERIDEARAIVEAEVPAMRRMPAGFGRLLSVAERLLRPSVEVAIVGSPDAPETRALLREAHRTFVPARVIGGGPPMPRPGSPPMRDPGGTDDDTDSPVDLPLLEGRGLLDGRPAAYVCRDFVCSTPTGEPSDLARQLGEVVEH